LPQADDAAHPVKVVGNKAVGPAGNAFATAQPKGFVTYGQTTLGAWLATRPTQPAVSPSVLRIMKAVSQNEGKLEAVNSYDNSFISFGILQWTAGAAGNEGELPALLNHLKAADAAAWQECFGQYGLDVKVPSATAAYGMLTLDGNLLDTPAKKAPLRNASWAYRFWRAGHHDSVRLAQFSWAAGRIGLFINKDVAGHPVGAWVTSEVGIAQLLDEHTNRPGHVPGTLAMGVAAIGATNPAGWTSADEHRLIEAYLKARHARPKSRMTDSVGRAAKIDALAAANQLSADRGSFAA
jgi:hypothetical protein